MGNISDIDIDESRRSFLKVTALVGGGFAVGTFIPGASRFAEAAFCT